MRLLGTLGGGKSTHMWEGHDLLRTRGQTIVDAPYEGFTLPPTLIGVPV